MGQGFSLATPSAGAAGIDIAQLQDVQYERSIGNARFMKSIRGRHENGVVLVKVLVKPFGHVNIERHRKQLIAQRKALADVPNALGFQRIIETETNGYLVRQYLYSSLYDRLSTRPFLEDIEKKWLAFQLLCALKDCHARDIYHGDIKAQNVLVTSWNWLYLTDFSSAYKPVMLPDDNPGDFSYFFDSSGRRTCYIAPERFTAAGDEPPEEPKMTWAMDIFSAGCVIAQMFLESEIFSLAQLYKYRRGEYDPVITHLSVIGDKDVREMIAHMIQIDPEKRYSADQYLAFWKDKVFPGYFYNFLHQYMGLVTDPSSGNSPMSGAQKNLGESDDRIDRVFYDFDKISYFLGDKSDKRAKQEPPPASRLGLNLFPTRLSIPNHEHTVVSGLGPPEDDGTLIFLTLVVSSMRTTARSSSRIRACDILLAFSERLTDEAKLDRVLPYLMTLLRKEESEMVIITAIRTITQLLQLVSMVTPINSHVLVEYVLPRMEIALSSKNWSPSSLIRATYAACIGSLAQTAQRFLEVASSLRTDGSAPVSDPEVEAGVTDVEANIESVFDSAGRQLFEILEAHTKQLVEDPNIHVRRAFLASVPELCMFFQEHANDILITHLNTYLNDRDWMLKCAFFDAIVGIATFVGSTSMEEFMLPLMVQALMDSEEFVVQAALHSLAQLAALGLLSRPRLWELVEVMSRLTMHPNIWVRESAAEFLAMASTHLSYADARCILMPMVKPYLKVDIVDDLSELGLLDALKKPISRTVFDQAVTWALKSDRGIFWKSVQQSKSLTFGTAGVTSNKAAADLNAGSVAKAARNEEDDQWLAKLRNLGLKPEDEMKLLTLRAFIWRFSKMKARDSSTEPMSIPGGLVSLQSLGVTPKTIFFHDAPMMDPDVVLDLKEIESGPYTIADALLDASMTIDDPTGKRRRAALNTHKNRVQSVGPRPSARLLSTTDTGRAGSVDARVSSTAHEDPYSTRRAIRHQSSALSLLGRKEGKKSVAETGTTGMNALGEMEGPFVAPEQAGDDSGGEAGSHSKLARHSYEGTDPSIQRMLDTMFIDNFPRDVKEFGPMIQPIARTKQRTISALPGEAFWKPDGQLVAAFGEHRGPVNRVIPSPDHVFFITGGNDGCVRVWDSARLERNITHRPRQTHKHADGARVIGLCFVENSHCFISCASDGTVHVVKVDTVRDNGVIRYGKLRVLREYQLPEGEYAVWCEHFRQESNSVLLLATNRSRILGIDLRTMTLMYVLENPVHHGQPTCFCVDKKRNWLCVGTSHGVVDLWDLRFKMRLKGWGIPGKSCIYRLCVHPAKGRGKWICVSGGTGLGEVTVWDLEKTLCKEIYRTAGGKDGPKTYEPWDIDDDRQQRMLGSFATTVEPTDTANADGGVCGMVVGAASGEDTREVRHAFLLTAGSDKRLRFWDMGRPENSCTYSGLQPDEPKPTYSNTSTTAVLSLLVEKLPRREENSKNGSGRASRATVISQQQQQLLQSHMDGILDVALLEYPCTMSVSVDRSGMVLVFQ